MANCDHAAALGPWLAALKPRRVWLPRPDFLPPDDALAAGLRRHVAAAADHGLPEPWRPLLHEGPAAPAAAVDLA